MGLGRNLDATWTQPGRKDLASLRVVIIFPVRKKFFPNWGDKYGWLSA